MAVEAGDNQTFNEVLVDTGSAILWVGAQTAYEPGPNTQVCVPFMLSCSAS